MKAESKEQSSASEERICSGLLERRSLRRALEMRGKRETFLLFYEEKEEARARVCSVRSSLTLLEAQVEVALLTALKSAPTSASD